MLLLLLLICLLGWFSLLLEQMLHFVFKASCHPWIKVQHRKNSYLLLHYSKNWYRENIISIQVNHLSSLLLSEPFLHNTGSNFLADKQEGICKQSYFVLFINTVSTNCQKRSCFVCIVSKLKYFDVVLLLLDDSGILTRH